MSVLQCAPQYTVPLPLFELLYFIFPTFDNVHKAQIAETKSGKTVGHLEYFISLWTILL